MLPKASSLTRSRNTSVDANNVGTKSSVVQSEAGLRNSYETGSGFQTVGHRNTHGRCVQRRGPFSPRAAALGGGIKLPLPLRFVRYLLNLIRYELVTLYSFKLMRRAAPPFLAHLIIHLFRTCCENFKPRSRKVRSPGYVK